MTEATLLKWVPDPDLPERPAELIDVDWQAGHQRLMATVSYATNRNEEDASAILIFEGVFSFAVFEENMDVLRTANDFVPLSEPYPYGGSWPYIEVLQSTWVETLTRGDGAWTSDHFRHFVITSRNIHLHVACLRTSEPTCVPSIAR